MMNYLRIPREITSAQVRANGNSWSAGMYQHVEIPTTATQCIAELITGYDKGSDPGSMYYMRKSPNYFIRTKALQEDSYLICAKGEAITPINPRVFEDMDL